MYHTRGAGASPECRQGPTTGPCDSRLTEGAGKLWARKPHWRSGFVTATASTSYGGDTSELSACIAFDAVSTSTPTPVPTATPTPTPPVKPAQPATVYLPIARKE